MDAKQAVDYLEEQKNRELHHSQMQIEEMNQKIEALNFEVATLQTALGDINKSNLGNETGYADFLGAVDNKDIEIQRKMQELNETEVRCNAQIAEMSNVLMELKAQKKQLEINASNLLYENDEMKDKMSQVEVQMAQQVNKIHFYSTDSQITFHSAQEIQSSPRFM